MMTRFLLVRGAQTTALAVFLATGFSWFLLGEAHGLAALVGGTFAGLDFLALIYVVGRLLDRTTSAKKKSVLGALLVLKFAALALVFYLVLRATEVPAAGVMLGIGAAICGFTLGLSRASASREGEALIRAEEERITAEVGEDAPGNDGSGPTSPGPR